MLVTDGFDGLLLGSLSRRESRTPNVYLISWQNDGNYNAEFAEHV